MVGDAKYKFVDLQRNTLQIHGDFYQILSYALFQKSTFAVLFYPGIQKKASRPIIFKFQRYGVTVWVVSFSLGNTDWSVLDKNISTALFEIKKEVENRLF